MQKLSQTERYKKPIINYYYKAIKINHIIRSIYVAYDNTYVAKSITQHSKQCAVKRQSQEYT